MGAAIPLLMKTPRSCHLSVPPKASPGPSWSQCLAMTCGSIGGIPQLVNPQKWGFTRWVWCGKPYADGGIVPAPGSTGVVAAVPAVPASPAGNASGAGAGLGSGVGAGSGWGCGCGSGCGEGAGAGVPDESVPTEPSAGCGAGAGEEVVPSEGDGDDDGGTGAPPCEPVVRRAGTACSSPPPPRDDWSRGSSTRGVGRSPASSRSLECPPWPVPGGVSPPREWSRPSLRSVRAEPPECCVSRPSVPVPVLVPVSCRVSGAADRGAAGAVAAGAERGAEPARGPRAIVPSAPCLTPACAREDEEEEDEDDAAPDRCAATRSAAGAVRAAPPVGPDARPAAPIPALALCAAPRAPAAVAAARWGATGRRACSIARSASTPIPASSAMLEAATAAILATPAPPPAVAMAAPLPPAAT